MKRVKENLYEKFDDTTDPVKDMHIGGIDLGKAWNETVNEGIRKWYVFLHDLELIGKKVTVTEKFQSGGSGTEKTFIIKEIKRGNMPYEIYFYYDDDEKEQKIMIDIHKKLYIHE